MAGDLDDFLRRAARRRLEKSVAQKEQKEQRQRQRPEYTSHHQERVTRETFAEEDDDEIVEAVMLGRAPRVPPPSSASRSHASSMATRQPATATVPIDVMPDAAAAMPDPTKRRPLGSVLPQENPLLALLKTPQGLQQAVLMREILERPEHRW